MTDTPKQTAPFGFRDVAEAEKQGLVNEVFEWRPGWEYRLEGADDV